MLRPSYDKLAALRSRWFRRLSDTKHCLKITANNPLTDADLQPCIDDTDADLQPCIDHILDVLVFVRSHWLGCIGSNPAGLGNLIFNSRGQTSILGNLRELISGAPV